jgi:hypothetical protein
MEAADQNLFLLQVDRLKADREEHQRRAKTLVLQQTRESYFPCPRTSNDLVPHTNAVHS